MFKKNKAFNEKGKDELNGNSINLVGDSTKIVGDVETETDIRVDGTVEGNIVTKGKLVLGESAAIKGNCYCHAGDFSGRINGNIYCKDQLLLKSTAQVHGDIFTKRFVVEKDANFNGQCEMREEINFPSDKNTSRDANGAKVQNGSSAPEDNQNTKPRSGKEAEKRAQEGQKASSV